MFRKLHGSRWGMLTGLAALVLLVATLIVASAGPAAAAIALAVIATLVGTAAITFLIAWIVRTDTELGDRRSRPPRGRDPRTRR
jgi:hypothetical protein